MRSLIGLILGLVLVAGCQEPQKKPTPKPRPNPPQVRVIVEYSASWCEPCRRAKPKVRQLGIPIREVDCTNGFPDGVESVPYYELYENGQKVGEAKSLSALLTILKLLGWLFG